MKKRCRADGIPCSFIPWHPQRPESHDSAGRTSGMGHEGAEYDAHLINIRTEISSARVCQHQPELKIPALVDHSGDKPIRIFESGAIMLYLADKFSALIPAEPANGLNA